MSNLNALAVNAQTNAAALANIAANGVVNTQIQQLSDDNKTLLQTSSAAQAIYAQSLTNMSAAITNQNFSTSQITAALNDNVTMLKDALASIQGIAGNTQVTSNLDFSEPGAAPAAAAPAAAAPAPPLVGNTGGSQFVGSTGGTQ